MENVKENKSSQILKIVLQVLYYVVIVLLLGFSIITIASRGDRDIPKIFGRGFLAVQSDSMVGENKDSFNKGDLIFVKILNDKSRENLKVGDVVTFYDEAIQNFNTHRIVSIEDGAYYTQGDNREVSRFPDVPRTVDKYYAVYSSKMRGVGKLITFLNTRLGFGLIIVLPIAGLFVYQGVKVLLLVNENKKQEQAIDLEAEKEKLRAEILKELKEELKENKE